MADIIDLNNKLNKQKEENSRILKKLKMHIIRNLNQCSLCHLKCARCSANIQGKDMSVTTSLPFHLCESCCNEYKAYIDFTKGNMVAKKKAYWLTDEWMAIWENWLAYQDSIKKYRESKEFLKLLNEVKLN